MAKNEKIRVLFLITDLGKGGAERYLIDLCKEIQKYDEFSFVIASLFDDNKYMEQTLGFPIRVLNFKTHRLLHRNSCEPYFKLLEEFKPHIIHTHRFLAEFLSAYYVNKDVKYICHGHDNMVQFERLGFKTLLSKRLFLNWMERAFIFHRKYRLIPTWFTVNSDDTLQYFKRVLPRSQTGQIKLVKNGFDYLRFYNPSDKPPVGGKRVKILNVGSFQPKKNQQLLILIAIELRRRRIDFEMTLAGDGETLDSIKTQIIANGLVDNVKLLGIRDDVPMLYRESDFYMHTAWYEPFGLVFLEAMAAGLPIITLDGKGNRDIIEDGKNGYLIQDQVPALFADAIEVLIHNESLYQQISKYGKSYAAQFDSSIKNREMLDFYRELVKEG